MADELVAFLAARLDEDEATAKRAVAMHSSPGNPVDWSLFCDQHSPDAAAHQMRHDPARVLREVEAKRAILARYGSLPSVTNLGEHLQRSQEQAGLDYAIRLLAAIWSDHPDYRPEWAAAQDTEDDHG